jgi:hypothetical protein
VFGRDANIVELLCHAGADVDQWVSTSQSALWHAEGDFAYWEIAAILRRYGASEK